MLTVETEANGDSWSTYEMCPTLVGSLGSSWEYNRRTGSPVWCCYITVDSAMAASQNGFCSYKLSFLKKTNIMQIMTKKITIFIYLIFYEYHREISKLDHFMALSLSYANTVLWRSRCKIHRFVAAPPVFVSLCPPTLFFLLLFTFISSGSHITLVNCSATN